ncbi:hypothetical protein MRS44_004659 [Fusarium solani]|uniref:uncharacterized protein n=1 Tax=Fusarium solani TaxID=169388 RepID=UPI0032C3E3EA|nr:hypothetical protein MRS44_004659 [Fusarium solani]
MTMRGWPRRGRRIDGSCAALLFGEEQAPSFYSSPVQSSPARIPVEAPTCRAMDAVRELEMDSAILSPRSLMILNMRKIQQPPTCLPQPQDPDPPPTPPGGPRVPPPQPNPPPSPPHSWVL